jgi:hypothetical protein
MQGNEGSKNGTYLHLLRVGFKAFKDGLREAKRSYYAGQVESVPAELQPAVSNADLKAIQRKALLHTLVKGTMDFQLGSIKGTIYGGPYRSKPSDIIHGVNMAKEIKAHATIYVPTVDFSIPDSNTFLLGLIRGVLVLREHGEIYVGCMGGIGRTGLYLGGLAKIMYLAGELDVTPDGQLAPYVKYVRDNYYGHAIETIEQLDFLARLDVSGITKELHSIA